MMAVVPWWIWGSLGVVPLAAVVAACVVVATRPRLDREIARDVEFIRRHFPSAWIGGPNHPEPLLIRCESCRDVSRVTGCCDACLAVVCDACNYGDSCVVCRSKMLPLDR